MRADGRNLNELLSADITLALKIAVDDFHRRDYRKSDGIFYRVFAEELYNRLSNNETYKQINSQSLNTTIIPNIYQTLKKSELAALDDAETHSKVKDLAKRDLKKDEGILNVLPNFPPCYNHYFSFKDYVLGVLILASNEKEFELRSIDPVIELYDVVSSGEAYVGKRNLLTLYRNDGRVMELSYGVLRERRDKQVF